jgi:hypothetical protein
MIDVHPTWAPEQSHDDRGVGNGRSSHLNIVHFAFALYHYNPSIIYCCPYHRRLVL